MGPRSRKQEKKLKDDARLLRWWRKHHAEQLQVALDGMHGDVVRGLMAQLKDLQSARKLVEYIAARDWSCVDAETRAIALFEINRAITKLRERADEETPISDPLPGAPLNAFLLIKQIITNSRIRGIAKPGSGASSGQTVTREAKEYVS